MPGSTPATSQLDWLSSTTAKIVLSGSKATRDLLKSFSWGITALRQLFASDDGAISSPPAPYHLSEGPAQREDDCPDHGSDHHRGQSEQRKFLRLLRRHCRRRSRRAPQNLLAFHRNFFPQAHRSPADQDRIPALRSVAAAVVF